jgi:hypothetical protein
MNMGCSQCNYGFAHEDVPFPADAPIAGCEFEDVEPDNHDIFEFEDIEDGWGYMCDPND